MKASGIIEIDLKEYEEWLIAHSGIKSFASFAFGVPRVSEDQFEVDFDCDDSGTPPSEWIGDTEAKKQWREYHNKGNEVTGSDNYEVFRDAVISNLKELPATLTAYGFDMYGRVTYKDEDGKDILELATGGWSDNEEIIRALMDNHLFWIKYWESTHRGGLYIFTQEINK
jgi:hypothetical protein